MLSGGIFSSAPEYNGLPTSDNAAKAAVPLHKTCTLEQWYRMVSKVHSTNRAHLAVLDSTLAPSAENISSSMQYAACCNAKITHTKQLGESLTHGGSDSIAAHLLLLDISASQCTIPLHNDGSHP
jgi:hypothetical protein